MLTTKRISLFKQTVSSLFKTFTSREGIKKFFGVSLYRNAVYLILDGAIPAVTGFVFWVVAARLYSTENIGLASAAISANGLLVGFSMLGLNNALIRFLPGATREQAQDIINSSFTVSCIAAVVLTIIFVTGLGVWSPALISLRNNPLFFIMFVIFVPVSLFDTIAGTIYVAGKDPSAQDVDPAILCDLFKRKIGGVIVRC
jgi:O-antigen/teichoic acid export membrane protein